MLQRFLIPLALVATVTTAAAQDTAEEQTPEQAQAEAEIEAASANATLAMKLCLENYRTPETLLGAFQQAGFSYTPEDFGGGADDTLHWFSTPEQHVQTAIALSEGTVECRIGTGLWGVEAMLPFAQQAFAALAGDVATRAGSPEGANILPGSAEAQTNPCSGFHAMLPQTMLWVQILRQGNDGSCISDGTSVIAMGF